MSYNPMPMYGAPSPAAGGGGLDIMSLLKMLYSGGMMGGGGAPGAGMPGAMPMPGAATAAMPGVAPAGGGQNAYAQIMRMMQQAQAQQRGGMMPGPGVVGPTAPGVPTGPAPGPTQVNSGLQPIRTIGTPGIYGGAN